MTVPYSNSNPVQFAGNSVTVTFSFPFQIFALTDLIVGFIVGGNYLEQGTGYTVPASSIGNSGGGQITFQSAPPLGTTVDLRTETPQTQPTNFGNLGSYLPENTTGSMDRLTRQVQDLSRLTYTFGIHGPDQESVAWPALPPPAQRLGTQLIFDNVTGLPGIGVVLPTTLTQSQFDGYLGGSNVGSMFYPITQGEINAAAPIANPYVRPGNPLRYAFNALPGITPMDRAFNFAAASLLGTPSSPGAGGELTVDMAYGPYNLEAGINCTWAGAGGAPPVTIRFLGSPINRATGCILNHSTIGIDCTGNDTIRLIDVVLTTQVIPIPTVFPQIGILIARNTFGGSLINRLIRVNVVGYFSIACVYNFGSEGVYLDNAYVNGYGGAGAGNCLYAITANNYANVQSLVAGLIYPGPNSVSMTVCGASNGSQFLMSHANSTSDCIHIEGGSHLGFRDTFTANLAGRSIFYIDNTTNTETAGVTLDNVNIDEGQAPQYMILAGAASAAIAHLSWNLRGLRSNTSVAVLAAVDANTTFYNWVIDPISEKQSNGIIIPGTIGGFSTLRLGATQLSAGAVTQGTLIIGDPASITIPAAFNQATMISNNAPPLAGFGTPSGGAPVLNYNPGTSTTTQDKEMIAIIAAALKLTGTFTT